VDFLSNGNRLSKALRLILQKQTFCFLFLAVYFLFLLIKKAKDKQQETGNKEHIVELALE